MEKRFKTILLFTCIILPLHAVEIERFEHIDTRSGLSQNNVLSIFCDNKGFLWFGTMDGLNRYDGFEFNIYKSVEGAENALTNNRISKIWEDSLHYLWVQTYEGYYHYLIPEKEEFITYPNYLKSLEEKNSVINCFYQASKNEIWLGSSNSGAYYLTYNKQSKKYDFKQFLSRGISSISNNTVNFIINDRDQNIWIGTDKGLNFLLKSDLMDGSSVFKHYFANFHFTSATQLGNQIYFGTKEHGIVAFDQEKRTFIEPGPPIKQLSSSHIHSLSAMDPSTLLIATVSEGLFLYRQKDMKWVQFNQFGKQVKSIYTDHLGMLWVVTEKFGITKIDTGLLSAKHYQLTPEELQPLIDDERLYVYEDKSGVLWVGTHGAGLGFYDRKNDRFHFYKNTPNVPGTLSSNFVHCISEDRSGLLWVGTGQFNGGINKIVKASSAFEQVVPRQKMMKLSDNVIRGLMQDSNGNIWICTKSGEIFIYNQALKPLAELKNMVAASNSFPGYNVYDLLQDRDGYIWLGTKGGGVLVSQMPLRNYQNNYKRIRFYNYHNTPSDTNSLSNNSVYSIIQDKLGNLWISTYGGGINQVLSRTDSALKCKRFNTSNSNISSNEVRNLMEDRDGNIWIGTTFGLNLLKWEDKNKELPNFSTFLFNPQKKGSMSYNDVIHIFQDSKERIWLATFGGGLNLLEENSGNYSFKHLNTGNGLINDAVFAITEDQNGMIWISTEKGISMLDPENMAFENYDINSGLFAENFSENTVCTTSKGQILFGSTNGMLAIYPENIEKSQYAPPVYITNFQLSNRDVDFRDNNAPIQSSIEGLEAISLAHNQSSFSFEYTALSYFAPLQNEYRFILENFDDDWNEVGNQRKATYTNIPPGNYVFKVKASSWDGTWNPNAATLAITIRPPWWKSVWAIWGYFFLSIVVIWISRRLFMNYYKLHNDLLVERRVNDIKLQFFTNISHEIRTPLTLVLGPIEDMKAMKNLPLQISERLQIIERNAKRMLRLINQLLDFRKIQKEKMTLVVQPTDLVTFTKEIVEHFKPLARQKKIEFIFASAMESQEVYIDIRKFDSVVFNILSNAFKYSPSNTRVQLEIVKGAEGFVDIVVTDQGPGIPKENLGMIFQRFSTLNAPNDGTFEGSGIGLNLSYEIMKLHKGEIEVDSRINIGSTFTIKLPLGKNHFNPEYIKPIDEAPAIQQRQPLIEELEELEEKIVDQSNKRKILIVEDNHEIIIYLKNILKNEYELKSANNGKEGIKCLSTYHPDMIITDVMMPEMDGIEFTKQIKNNIEVSHIPIIMLTAKSTLEDQIIGIEAGAEAYLLKPFNSSLLKAMVNNMLKQRENTLKRYSEKDYTGNLEVKVTPKDDEFMQSIVKIIEKNYQNPEFNVEKLVDMSSVSRTLLYNKLKGLTGLSPVEFIRQLRLRYAAAILKESGRGVSETAYLTGFNDIKYFRKCFKDMYGVSPKEFKQPVVYGNKKTELESEDDDAS
jgi:signal transduction histidine kinase/ligand-binding sensor domain-containing protein/DNA-binding response OmpR family regulator